MCARMDLKKFEVLARKTELNVLGPKIRNPFRMLISGPSHSGKSTFIFNILKVKNIFDTEFHCIKYYYSFYQPLYDIMKKDIPGISFYKGLPKQIDKKHNKTCLLVFDDLLLELNTSTNLILNLFTVSSHHADKSVMLVSQSLFFKVPMYRTLTLNANYLIIFANPRDRSQIVYIGKQMFPHKPGFLPMAYHIATANKPFSFIFLDLNQLTPDHLRVWGDILQAQPLVYT